MNDEGSVQAAAAAQSSPCRQSNPEARGNCNRSPDPVLRWPACRGSRERLAAAAASTLTREYIAIFLGSAGADTMLPMRNRCLSATEGTTGCCVSRCTLHSAARGRPAE
jgi:hypothetical protein